MIVAFGVGTAYAATLWFLASRVARRRSLALGTYPVITIAGCGLASTVLVHLLTLDIAALATASLIGTIVCAIVDARTGLIFDVLSLSMTVVAGILALISGRVADGVVAALVVGGVLLALHLATGRRGIGMGDVKLAAALALGYGVQLSLVAIGSAFILGAGYGSVLLSLGQAKRSDALRFGPFIAGGAAVGLTAHVLGYR